MADVELNEWEATNARQSAADSAQAAYNQGMLELGRQDLAFRRAQQAWKEVMDKAGLTGTFEGMPTQQALQYGAEAFGIWGAPQQGQTTLAKQQQDWSQGAQNAALYGSNVGQGGPASGTLTLGGAEQQFTQGLRTQQEQRAAQAQQQTQAQQYLNLLASLRGPADWAKYQEVLGSTPGGMRDLVGAAMGQYVPGGGATTGYQPQAANLTTMMQQVQGQPVTWTGQGSVPQGQLNMANVYQGGQGSYGQQPQQQAYTNQYQYPQQAATAQYSNTQGMPQAAPQTQEQLAQQLQQRRQAYQQQLNPMQQQVQQMFQAPSGTSGAQQTQAMLQGQLNPQVAAQQQAQQQYQQQQLPPAAGNGTNMMGESQARGYQNQPMNLPAPNQIAPQSWNNLAPSQKEMLMGQYEAAGWHKPDVEALRTQALPKYAANAPTAGTFRLR